MAEKEYTILHVEDLEKNRMLVRRILESRSYTVVDAENGLTGIAKAKELLPDLILMDINLPDLDGFSVVSRIRSDSSLAQIPIIAVTARNVSDDAKRARAIGCDSYISKPFNVADLLKEVQRFLGTKHQPKQTADNEYYLREHTGNLVKELERRLNELKVTHEELAVMHERLQRLDAAKTDFIHVAAHELRTPLTMVLAYTDMIKSALKVDEDDPTAQYFDGLRAGVNRLGGIVDDMINIVRVELATIDLAYSPQSVAPILQKATADFEDACRQRNLMLTIVTPDNLPQVIGDGKQLQQLFARLIGNAVKYTPDGGRITISAEMHEPGSTTDEEANRQFVEVAVADTGIGIDQAEQALIFEKFYTAEDTKLHSSGQTEFRAGGPGLGLTIAKGIVEAHGGRIWVESDGYNPDTNPGSVFCVLLPTG